MAPSRIIIDKSNANIFNQVSDSFLTKIVNNSTYWHRFTLIDGAQFPKEEILQLIIEKVFPADLIPVKYQTEGNDTFFLARNCGPAIRSLGDSGLTIEFPDSGKIVHVQLVLCYKPLSEEPIVMKNLIATANRNRYSYQHRILDLSEYHRDPDLKDIFPLLCMPKTMKYVINLSKQHYYHRISLLVLASNNLTSLEELYSLGLSKNLKGLDLRNNKLTWEGLSQLPAAFKLKDIWLDGNPLCNTYSSSLPYIMRIKSIMPTLETIDDRNVNDPIDPCEYLTRNFLVKPSDSCTFVNHFLSQYMKLFEGDERWLLEKMYHLRAVFSLSTFQLPGQSLVTKLSNYMPFSRNILTMSDYARIYEQLRYGPDQIMDTLCKLPKIQFDPYSFTVDVPMFEDQMVLINLTGIFREVSNILFMYSFHRTFILQPCRTNTGEWKIVNDMLTVTNVTAQQANKCFTNGDLPLSRLLMDKMLMEEDEKLKLTVSLSQVTTMNHRWSNKFLENASWDLEMALQSFIDQFKTNSIPCQAFAQDLGS